MNKPPEKIQLVYDREGELRYTKYNAHLDLYYLDKDWPNRAPHTEHFYTLEKPMTQKTENLTTEEAWIAMVNGQYVKSFRKVYTIYAGELLEWSMALEKWMGVTAIGVGPYSIVPDPSKPKEVEDEYNKKRAKLQKEYPGTATREILDFVDEIYARKP